MYTKYRCICVVEFSVGDNTKFEKVQVEFDWQNHETLPTFRLSKGITYEVERIFYDKYIYPYNKIQSVLVKDYYGIAETKPDSFHNSRGVNNESIKL
jgi:hypothetical protein